MRQESTMTGTIGWVRGFTRYQWLVFLACWLGWTLDGTNFALFSFVLKPAVTTLVGGTATVEVLGRVGGYLAMVGLLGWAIGGFVFGTLADYIGRVRTLAISIAMYSVFTALQGFSQTVWQLGLFRFLGGLGTGAELVVGIPLVAEAFAENSRARVLGLMMTGSAFGTLLAAQEYHLFAPYGWRVVFFAGIIPALLLLLIRRGMVEPEHFAAVRARRKALAAAQDHSAADREFMRFSWRQLFSPQNRYSTMVGLLFATGTLLAIWTTQIWLPTIQAIMLHNQGVTGAAVVPFITLGMEAFAVGGILGYAAFGFLADAIGRRPTIILYSIGYPRVRLRSLSGRAQLGTLSVSVAVVRVLRFRGLLRPRGLSAGAVPHAYARHRGRVLQRLGPRDHQLRPAGRGAAGRALRRQLRQGGGSDDRLCTAQHHRRRAGAGDQA